MLILFLLFMQLQTFSIVAKDTSDTFENPVIWADVPDPSVIRVGDTFYMSSTTMHLNPGLPIMTSKDLVNWEIATYVYDVLEKNDNQTLRNGQNEYGQGSWASSLRYHDGTFYVAVASFSAGKTYIFQTNDVENGEWTRSTFDRVYHDMSLLFDDDGRVYMVYGGGNIEIIELTSDATAIKPGGLNQVIIPDAGQIIPGNDGLPAEGAHIQKINGYYYIFLITWPDGGIRTELVYRADQIDGDYEGKIALSDSGIAQGGVVDTPDGDWYGFLFGDRGSVGRIPYLVPVTWEDDWPIFGVDGKVPEEMDIPVKGVNGNNQIVASDEFFLEDQEAQNEDLPTSTTADNSEPVVEETHDEAEATELIENGTFEAGEDRWTNTGSASIQKSNQEFYRGEQSLLTSNRLATGDGPSQVITGRVEADQTYQFSAKIKYTEGPEQKQFNFNIQNGPSWEGIEVLGSAIINKGEWGTVEGTYTLRSDTDLSETFIFIETPWSNNPDPTTDLFDFYVDDVSFSEQNPGSIEREQAGEYDLNVSKLPLVWQWNHNPNNNYWSLTDRSGYLRLTNGRTNTNILDARNTLTQRTFGPESSGEVAIEINQMKNGDVTGLAAFQANYGFVGVMMENDAKSIIMVKGTPESEEEIIESIPIDRDRIYLKIDFDFKNQTDKADFYYSFNGVEWHAIGDRLQMRYTLPHFMGYRFALFNYATENPGGYVDFDYFRVNDAITGTEGTSTVLNAMLSDVSGVKGAPSVEIDIPVSIDQLPEGSYTSIQASFKIPENLTVTGVDFNSDNIEGIGTYSYSNNQLILDVEGDQANFSHQSSDIFATIKLEVNQAITSDRTDLLRLNYLNVTGDEVVYNVHDAVATIEFINPSNHSQGDELAQTSSNLYLYLLFGSLLLALGSGTIYFTRRRKAQK